MSTMTRGTLAQAKLYLCTDARQHQGDLADFLDAVLANGGSDEGAPRQGPWKLPPAIPQVRDATRR